VAHTLYHASADTGGLFWFGGVGPELSLANSSAPFYWFG